MREGLPIGYRRAIAEPLQWQRNRLRSEDFDRCRISDSEQYNLLDQLAEEFADRFRRGERPSLKEYTDRYPELADEIRELFPAMVKVEQVDEGQVNHESEAETRGPARSLQQIGDYRIVGEIGRGGMGVVYEAEQVSLGRRVALKVLPRHVAADRMTLERFRREARAAARLHHTNIVPVFEVGQDGDVRFYAMQFIQGQSLDGVIAELRHLRIQSQSRASGEDEGEERPETRTLAPSVAHSILAGGFLPEGERRATSANRPGADRGRTRERRRLPLAKAAAVDVEATEAGPLSEFAPDSSSTPTPLSSAVLPGGTQLSVAEMSHRVFHRSVAHIGRQAASALAHAHARGVIHRDIKPSNLLLDTDGVVWVTDFGLAKAEDDGLTQTGDVLGTIRYMAPERFSGQADPRSDVYALGLTLYELLVLRPAFDSPNRLALIELVKNVDPPRPRSIDPRIPLDLETIVLKAVEKDPKARYASADAMSEDLRRFLADEPIQARQVSTAERYWRWARRNPMIATLGGVLTALLVAVTVGSMLAAAYFKESARRESNLAAREQLANQQSQRDRKDAIEARRQAIQERDQFAAAIGGPGARQGNRPGRGRPRRPGLALDARGLEDRSGRRGGIPEDGSLEPGCVARAGPQAAQNHRYWRSVRLRRLQPGRKIVCNGFQSSVIGPSRHRSTFGTPPRGESSPRCPVHFRPVRLPTGR